MPFRRTWCSDSTYKITLNKGQQCESVTNDDELLEFLCQDDNGKRVLFFGKRGIGKTHLFRNIARKWMNGEILKDNILIYLHLDYVPKGANMLEEILKNMGCKINEEACQTLHDELKNRKSIVMLDGISNWSRFNTTSPNIDYITDQGLTIEELLKSKAKQLPEMKIWVSSDDTEDNMKLFHELNTPVELQGFNEEQIKYFFRMELHPKMYKIWTLVEGIQRMLGAKPRLQEMLDEWDTHLSVLDERVLVFSTRSPLLARLFTSFFSTTKECGITIRQRDLWNFFKPKNEIDSFIEQCENFDILACLLEVGTKDEDVYKEYATMLYMMKLVFRQSNSDYYQEAILHLLKTLYETDVSGF